MWRQYTNAPPRPTGAFAHVRAAMRNHIHMHANGHPCTQQYMLHHLDRPRAQPGRGAQPGLQDSQTLLILQVSRQKKTGLGLFPELCEHSIIEHGHHQRGDSEVELQQCWLEFVRQTQHMARHIQNRQNERQVLDQASCDGFDRTSLSS